MQSEGVSLSLSHSLSRSASHSLFLSLSSLSTLHSPFAYQLTARILISFQYCSSSAASLYQSPNPFCPPRASLSDNFVKNKISFLFQMPATTIKSESICKISKQKTEKQKRTLQFIRLICLLPFAFAFAYKSVRLYTRISHICAYIYSILYIAGYSYDIVLYIRLIDCHNLLLSRRFDVGRLSITHYKAHKTYITHIPNYTKLLLAYSQLYISSI